MTIRTLPTAPDTELSLLAPSRVERVTGAIPNEFRKCDRQRSHQVICQGQYLMRTRNALSSTAWFLFVFLKFNFIILLPLEASPIQHEDLQFASVSIFVVWGSMLRQRISASREGAWKLAEWRTRVSEKGATGWPVDQAHRRLLLCFCHKVSQ